MEGRMKRFPTPSSQTRITYKYSPGEYMSIDIIPMKKKSVRGYNCFIQMIDRATDQGFVYFMKTEEGDEFLANFKNHCRLHNKNTNPRVVDMQLLLSDGGKQATAGPFLEHLVHENIHLNLSGPYKQVQNRNERFTQTYKGGISTCMKYNNAPFWLW
jgi:hypothetical protein